MNVFKAVIIASLLLSANMAIAEYSVSNEQGTVSFSGQHAGMKFKGKFTAWNANIHLPSDENSQDTAFINASFQLRSAQTGDSIYDETLPEGDWFDADNHPVGTFKSASVNKSAMGYDVLGELSLRGKSLPVNFTLIEEGDRLTASFVIDRLAYGIGFESDPDAEWVSKDIQMGLDIPQP